MDKEDILKRSRREKDEGLTYAQDRGRQYGVVGFLVLFLVIMIYNMVRGLDNSLPLTLFWAYLSCEAAGPLLCPEGKERAGHRSAGRTGLPLLPGLLHPGDPAVSPARPLGPARLVLTFVLLSALFLLALLAGMLRLLVLALVPAQ